MSNKKKWSSSGSRFAWLPQEGEDSDDDSVFGDDDFSTTHEPGPSKVQSFKLRPSQSSQRKHIPSRSVGSTSTLPKQPSDLPAGGHKRESQTFEDVESPGDFDEMFGEKNDAPQQLNLLSNIESDVRIFKDVGFNIDYPDGHLGEGQYGDVYKGHYGVNVPDYGTDRFAVKIIEFGEKDDPDTLDKREKFETEKYILTQVNHENVVAIRMIINMGDVRSFPFLEEPTKRFLSPDRVYLIMDFADGGNFEDWVEKNYRNIDALLRISLVRDLFFGLLYLHSMDILHGDVHSGNALIFTKNEEIVAKWTDFGLGLVGSDKQYRFRVPKRIDMRKEFRFDIDGLNSVIWYLMSFRKQGKPETPEETTLMDEVSSMLQMMRDWGTTSLHQVHQRFKHILEDELYLEEEHYM